MTVNRVAGFDPMYAPVEQAPEATESDYEGMSASMDFVIGKELLDVLKRGGSQSQVDFVKGRMIQYRDKLIKECKQAKCSFDAILAKTETFVKDLMKISKDAQVEYREFHKTQGKCQSNYRAVAARIQHGAQFQLPQPEEIPAAQLCPGRCIFPKQEILQAQLEAHRFIKDNAALLGSNAIHKIASLFAEKEIPAKWGPNPCRGAFSIVSRAMVELLGGGSMPKQWRIDLALALEECMIKP